MKTASAPESEDERLEALRGPNIPATELEYRFDNESKFDTNRGNLSEVRPSSD